MKLSDFLAQFIEGYLVGPLVIDPEYRTLYAIVGDVPWLLLGAVLFALAIIGKRPSRAPTAALAEVPGSSRDTPVTEKVERSGSSEEGVDADSEGKDLAH